MYIQNSTELPFPLYTGLPLLSLYRVITFRNTKLVIEHRASFIIFIEHKAYNHTQSFSPAGIQCLTSTIHNTQGLCYLPGCFRPQSPTPQAKLCAFARNPPAAQSLHLFQCTELRLLHKQYKDICPIIYKTQQNTKLVIEHRASPPREHSA